MPTPLPDSLRGRVILALDLGSKVGWACGSDLLVADCVHGTLKLPDEVSAERQFAAFADWLADRITEHEPHELVIEAPFLYAHGESLRAVRKLFGLATIAGLIAWRRDCKFREYAVSSVRKTFCGSGRADKAAVMAECQRRMFVPVDANAADAIALLHHAAGQP